MSEAALFFLFLCIGYGGGSLLAFGVIMFFENRAEKKRKARRRAMGWED